ncbi:HdeD family acid-resistance protein [Streptomyces sp. XM83C]|jgi:uncharacterized membrane protein HdeD (DUF308 family)|uniref:HdeD family acid-resistance protein n=1 Tax=Streptomyces thermocoprophilus TaxID=78356 RepID=A0ABV5VH17_9ACTN|nr:HdeD family acid-resistance protein [Streptomyces sp. XM83C]MCK1822794.1 HdeD family acid-resistance protein [Streptomyces sp. XM83C]
MTTSTPPPREAQKLSRGFGWLAVLGVILVLAGLVGLVYTGVATLTSMLLFGWLLLIGGVVGLLHAVQARGTSFFWLGVIVAALNIAAGVVVIRRPDAAAAALAMFAALLFLSAGLFRLVGSLVVRGPQFGWTLMLGAFDLLLGILVLGNWPSSSQYVIGTFFSLALLFDGLGLVATGFGGRRIVGMVSDRLTGDGAPGPDGVTPAPGPDGIASAPGPATGGAPRPDGTDRTGAAPGPDLGAAKPVQPE